MTTVTFLYALHGRGWERAYVGAGYCYTTAWSDGAEAQTAPAAAAASPPVTARIRRTADALKEGSYVGGIQYYEAQMEDARFTLLLAEDRHAIGASEY